MFRRKKKKKPKIEAKLERTNYGSFCAIKVDFLKKDGNKYERGYRLGRNNVSRQAEIFSNNELKQIWADCQGQINSMDPDDVSPYFKEIVEELTEAMKKRKINLDNLIPSLNVEEAFWLKT